MTMLDDGLFNSSNIAFAITSDMHFNSIFSYSPSGMTNRNDSTKLPNEARYGMHDNKTNLNSGDTSSLSNDA